MYLSTLATAFVALLSAAHAWDTTTVTITSTPSTITSSPVITGPTYTCPLITQTGGSGCPSPPSNCTIDECITEVLVTQPCTCLSSLPTTTFCETTCHTGCQTTTSILRIPCATSLPSSSPTSSSSSGSSSCTDASCLSSSSSGTSSSSVSSSSSSSCTSSLISSSSSPTSSCTDASCVVSSTSSSSQSSSPTSSTTSTPIYSNSTVTVTSITTLTTCPYNNKCHGQTTTWTGSSGPTSCSATLTCTCVLPGGGSSTITGPTTTPSNIGQMTTTQVTTVGQSSTSTSSVTSNAKSTSTGLLQSSWGEKRVADGWVGMIVAGLLGLL